MTHNQIDYWNLQETKRHNTTTEQESGRHNLADETETNRHNVATEQFNIANLNEQSRHNIVTEETERGKLSESVRHNKAGEQETNRHNVATEGIQMGQLQETQRHNKATESATLQDLNIKSDTLAESVRHNKAVEGETNRHNVAGEQVESGKLSESIRHNQTTESTNKYDSVTKRLQAQADQAYKQAMTEIDRFNSANKAALSQQQIKQISAQIKDLERSYNLAKAHGYKEYLDALNNAASNVTKSISSLGGLLR